MRRSYLILGAVILVHVSFFVLLSNFVVFQSYQSSDVNSASAFQQVALVTIKPKTSLLSDEAKAAPLPAVAPPSINFLQTPEANPNPSVTITTSTSRSFNITKPSTQIPSLSEIMSRAVVATGVNGQIPGLNVSGGASAESANLFGMDINSDGPIMAFLDTSDSLKSQHDMVATEIRKLLPSCTIVEINGVVFSTRATLERLKATSGLIGYLDDYYLSLVDGSIIPRVTELIKNNKLPNHTTIYYFSDFEDYADSNDVNEFSHLLQDHNIRFYAYSVEKEPSDAIKRMCTDTGGSWKLKPPQAP